MAIRVIMRHRVGFVPLQQWLSFAHYEVETEAVRRAEAELAATTRLSELKPVAKVLMRAKAELKAVKQAAEQS
jgi:hypothetical protein